jgi:chaperonin GroES
MIVPLSDRVLLEKVEAEKQTASGILLAETTKEKPSMATVVALGPGKEEKGIVVPMGIEVGQTVIFKQYAGTDVKYENKEFLIVEIKDILAIVE